MNLEQIAQECVVIKERLWELLDDDGKRAIETAIRELRKLTEERQEPKRQPAPSRELRRKQKRAARAAGNPWRLEIAAGTPLRFSPTTISGGVRHVLTVDIYCQISEPVNGAPSLDHNIVLRVWSEDPDLCYRQQLDAWEVFERFESAGRRVMHRVHFDFANAEQPGPRFHLQFGGSQGSGEGCWLPENLKLPRYPHHPLGLITACEFVVRTFFPSFYERLAEEPSWRGAIARSQEVYLIPYLRQLVNASDRLTLDGSALDRLWNCA
jgi:hypothetical protein